jgi:hypothetical protein
MRIRSTEVDPEGAGMSGSWMQTNAFRSSAVFFVAGAVLIAIAFTQAALIPHRAHDDFSALIQAHGGGMTHTATYPDTYRLMSANRRMLQNVYLGASGLVLLAVGCTGLTRSFAPRSAEAGA